MNETRDDELERIEVLLALKSLLEYAKLSADDIAAEALSEAIRDATDIAHDAIDALHD